MNARLWTEAQRGQGTMNLREGTRRLALLLGVAGAIAGGFASYVELQPVMRQRADHQRFEQLANSDVVQHERKDWFLVNLPPGYVPATSEVKASGIKTINWTKNLGIESIETEDGQTLYPTPAPSAWMYLLIAIFPIAGFFIPWGTIRAIGWVGVGFSQPST